MKLLIIVFIALYLSACASPDYNYRPVTTNISEPPIQAINTAYVGDEMLKQGTLSEHDVIYLPSTVSIGLSYDLHPGYYLKQGEDKDTETYFPGSGNDGGVVEKAVLADPWKAVMAYKNTQKLCIITAFNVASCEKSVDFFRKKKPVISTDSFQQTLIYSGKVGNKINIGYREFSGNVARPGFHNDVEYDLSSSNIIGYKGAQIEIIEATNQYIKYKVIKNFNKAVY